MEPPQGRYDVGLHSGPQVNDVPFFVQGYIGCQCVICCNSELMPTMGYRPLSASLRACRPIP
jgi:hypothetical protein